ncbi:MAG: hypothetical protein NVSMB3_15410 [Acidobacteriaceae bacterium]
MPRTVLQLLSLFLACSALAQAPAALTQSPPQPQTLTQQTPTGAAPPTASAPTIQTRTNLVVVDLVLTDRSGKNVHGLQPSDLVLTENGKPQQIRSFEEHTAPLHPPTPESMPELPPGVFTNYTPFPQTAALNILLLDTLNTPLADQSFVRQQILKYLRSAPPGNRIAIFGLTTHLIYLQGFTSDPELLRTAVDKKSMRPSQILDNAATGRNSEQLSGTTGSSEASSHGALADVVDRLKQFEAESQTFQLQLRLRYTLDGMNTLAHYLSGFPGRKNVIWFSGSFPINVLPDGALRDPFAAMSDMSDQFRETTSLIARAQVAVYPVDARGLFNAPINDASERAALNPQNFSQQLNKFNQQTAEEHATMREMAEQTGGRAFLNTNGLAEAVQTAINTGANFYTIAYTPSDATFNGSYRKVGLKLQGRFEQSNLSLAYRRGYYAVNPGPAAPPRRALVAGGSTLPVPPSPAALPPQLLVSRDPHGNL